MENETVNIEIARNVTGIPGQGFEQRVFRDDLIDDQNKVNLLESADAGGRVRPLRSRRNANLQTIQINAGYVPAKQAQEAGGKRQFLNGD